jgi:hypothetical protein
MKLAEETDLGQKLNYSHGERCCALLKEENPPRMDTDSQIQNDPIELFIRVNQFA